MSFSPDGRTLASGGSRGTIYLWDVETGEQKHTFTGYSSGISSLSFSPDGRTLASGRKDGTIHLWGIVPMRPEPERLAADINADGVVNIQDLVLVAADFGQMGEYATDVNGDGTVNIQDLVAVAAAFGESAAAPAVIRDQATGQLTSADVQQWLPQAQQMDLKNPNIQRGILILQHLLAALTPKETALLPNYPNPFNPETWIPYQLAEANEVAVTIYAAGGEVVRILALGYQLAGLYQSRGRSAYWDGRNDVGEPVASGVYFYTLTAGEFTATRKMLIRK